jgi:hypothetical protein
MEAIMKAILLCHTYVLGLMLLVLPGFPRPLGALEAYLML